MKNVLYVGPYRQLDEWGMTSRAFVESLARQKDINLFIRPVWFNQDNTFIDIGDLVQYENKKLIGDKDVLIQHGIPTYLNYNGDFKQNIMVLSIDCQLNHDWKRHVDMFDKVVVFSEYEKTLLEESKVETEICHFDRPPMFSEVSSEPFPFNFQGLKFYTNVSLDKKAAMTEIACSYYSAFTVEDETLLVLCIPPNEAQGVEKRLEEIKHELGIYGNASYYPQVAIAPISDLKTMNFMHGQCDYYIDASYNCRVSQNALKALFFKSKPILLNTCGGLFKDEYELLIESNKELISYRTRPIQGLYSGRTDWNVPSTSHLKSLLQTAYKNPDITFETKEFDENKIKEILCS